MENIEAQVKKTLASMTLDEKIGQMTQVEKNSLTPEDVRRYAIGSVLSGGGGNPEPNTPQTWRQMTTGFQQAALETRLGIPILYGTDAVHGHNNVRGATIFPHNIGLGAAGDPELVSRIARITALEILATGAHWNFAPTVAVPQDIRWGRTYEGFGQDTRLVSELGAAFVKGTEWVDGQHLSHRHSVLSSVKHFVGDGGTAWGSADLFPWHEDFWGEPERDYGIDQGDMEVDENTLRSVHLAPYVSAISAGARNIMVSYSSWNGQKMHAHKYLLTDVLKSELGFSGFTVSDWGAVDKISPAPYRQNVAAAINAGVDMVMVPFKFKKFIRKLRRAVEKGQVPISRIDEAVSRILRVKLEMNLPERPFGDPALLERVGSADHRAVAREAVQRSAVLLKNDNAALPVPAGTRIYLAGPAADDIGLQCGGWSVEWMGKTGPITPGTTLREALEGYFPGQIAYQPQADFSAQEGRADYGILVLAEKPYAEGVGDRENLNLTESDLALAAQMRALCNRLVVVLYSGRPLLITEQLPDWDAFVAAWLPGTEGQGLADLLAGQAPFSARLPLDWPRNPGQIPLQALQRAAEPPLWAKGFGLNT